MLELAVITHEETFNRMKDPLKDRGILARYIDVYGRGISISKENPIELQGIDVGFVYPSRIMEGGVIDAFLEVPWVNGLESVVLSRNKGRVLTILNKNGFDVPSTVMISNPIGEEELIDAYEKIENPMVIKPNSATRGLGIALVDDVDSFEGIVDYIRLVQDRAETGDRSFLIQEYIPDAKDYRVMVIDGEYVGAVERRFVESDLEGKKWKKNVHRNAIAVKAEMPGPIRKIAEEVASLLGIKYVGIDILVNKDRVVINETNARPTIDQEEKYSPLFYDKLAGLIEKVSEGY